MSRPLFLEQPVRFLRWFARERPAWFWSLAIGAGGPISLAVVPPIRRYFGDTFAPFIPMTYPVPTGPRKKLTGFDDDTEDAQS